MTSPRWARAVLRFLAPRHREDDVVGDLEESHRGRVVRRGRSIAWLLSSVEALDIAATILRDRLRRSGPTPREPKEASHTDLLTGIGISWLDVKLAFRMLVRFPGLTVVASLAIAFSITLAAGTYDFFQKYSNPVMPFEDGDRIVNIHSLDLERGGIDRRALHDFVTWRDELRTLQEVGAWQSYQRNLITELGVSVPRIGAAVTADLLSIPRVPPMLGRLLSEADEVPGAPEVVLLGYDVWRTQFGADPDVVGSPVRLGPKRATVVGVMPEGFEWPREYTVWTPMRLNPLDYELGESPSVSVAARLSPDVDHDEAQAELDALALRRAAAHPDTHRHLRPEVVPFGAVHLPISGITVRFFYSLTVITFGLLMLLVCGNVALLLFARTAARESEIVVRSALGASRGRIVAQLFVEALLLGSVATAMGLWGAQAGVSWVVGVLERMGDMFGFWFDEPLSNRTRVLAALVTLPAAALSGAVPALKVTGSRLGAHLQRAGATSGLEFGRLWTTVIVSQIAVTVAFVPTVVFLAHESAELRAATYGFEAEEYLAVELAMGGGDITMAELGYSRDPRLVDADLGASALELERRLADEPGVGATTLASQIPGPYHPWRFVEIEGPVAPGRSAAGYRVRWAGVDPGFFDALGVRMVAGRSFDAADVETGERVAIVNEDFVRNYLEDRNATGRRFRFRDPAWREGEPMRLGPWYQIVGVVEQIAMTMSPEYETMPGYYVPLRPSDTNPVTMAVRVGADPLSLAPRVRRLAAEVDPNMIVADVRPLDDSAWEARVAYDSWFWVVAGAGGIGLLLATVGIYSIMSFTVARRTREIGVRAALGAGRRGIVWGIFARALKQIGMGIAAGGVLIALFGVFVVRVEAITPTVAHGLWLVGYLSVMTMVCSLACIVPTSRALAIEPTEALRADG